jgi:hypothetical protein
MQVVTTADSDPRLPGVEDDPRDHDRDERVSDRQSEGDKMALSITPRLTNPSVRAW